MITANIAKEISAKSESNVIRLCEIIGKHIEKAAALGKYEIQLVHSMDSELQVENDKLSHLQLLVKAELQKNNFTVMTKSIMLKPSFRDMDDSLPVDKFYTAIIVSWY